MLKNSWWHGDKIARPWHAIHNYINMGSTKLRTRPGRQRSATVNYYNYQTSGAVSRLEKHWFHRYPDGTLKDKSPKQRSGRQHYRTDTTHTSQITDWTRRLKPERARRRKSQITERMRHLKAKYPKRHHTKRIRTRMDSMPKGHCAERT